VVEYLNPSRLGHKIHVEAELQGPWAWYTRDKSRSVPASAYDDGIALEVRNRGLYVFRI
jgi:hypothetical protein